jgi:HlyD family secretion protein
MLLRKHPLITVISIAIVLLLVWGFWPQPVKVEGQAARRAPLTITIEEEGRTRVIDRYVIAAPVDGVTCRVRLNVGDPVKKGETLLTITPMQSRVLDPRSRAQAKAKVDAAEAALHAASEQARAASAAAELASNELARLTPLLKQGVITRDAFDKAQTAANTASANQRSADFKVEVASYELDAARSVLEYPTDNDIDNVEQVAVHSPIDGRILKVDHECAGPVRTGEPLLEVGDPAALEVEVDVLSADAVQIKPGMQVLFDRWGGEGLLEGQVRVVEPVGFTKVSALGVEEQRVLIISDFTSEAGKWQRLGDGYRVEARFILWHEESVLQVPASSLFRYRDGWALFLAKDDRAERRRVTVGQRNGLVAQILDGVSEGDTVILHPSDEVEDERRVTVRDLGLE